MRKAIALVIVGFGIVGLLGATPQTSSPSVALPADLLKNVEKLRNAAMGSDYAWRQVAHLTQNIGPRLAGSVQAQAAVAYVAGELKHVGLEVKLEKTLVPHWVRGEERAELVAYPGQVAGTTQKIVLTALGSSGKTPDDGLTAEVVVVDSFDELKALGREKISGRVVLLNDHFDRRMAAAGRAGAAYEDAALYRRTGPQEVAKLGAVACLVRSVGNADYRLPHTGYSAPAGIPAAAVTSEDADLLADLARQGPVRIHLVLTPQTLPQETSYNVIADLPGSEHPEEVVIVSGHLDSWDLGTGAIDDGAGVAVAMETAQLVKDLGLRPRRTLRVIAWMDEESSQAGDRTYFSDYQGAMAHHVAAIESDSGAGHPMGFKGSFSDRAASMLERLSTVLAPIGATLFEDTGGAEADVDPMMDAGVPVFGLLQDERTYFNYHHTAADTLDKIDPHELAENAAAMVVLAYALADMPEPIPHSVRAK